MTLPKLDEVHIAMLTVANAAMRGTDRMEPLKPDQLIRVALAVREAADGYIRIGAEELSRQGDDARKERAHAQI